MNSTPQQFGNTYKDRCVLVTGHTGFKGSWLCLWLVKLGARIVGYSLPPPTHPNHFELLSLPITSIIGDIRDREKLFETFKANKPEIVFHLAAQPLVRRSYLDPITTFETNVIGTLNIFEACRMTASVKAIINVTSDKCYENREWVWGYREIEPMGGYDPYSASKGCSELLTASYRRSYFNSADYGKSHNTLLASVRAGNVIGGGDWAEDRLIPDIIKATSKGEKVFIRSPQAIRPWQHVLDPLSGYLLLGQRLLEGRIEFADAWNFGPDDNSNISVLSLANRLKNTWGKIDYILENNPAQLHEAITLKLDCSKAKSFLYWHPIWDIDKAIYITAKWYKDFYEHGKISSEADIDNYIASAQKFNQIWLS